MLVPGGLEEADISEDIVEYALYGAEGELPDLPALQAAAGDALVEVSSSQVPDDWADRWKAWHRPVDVAWRFRRLRVRPPWEPALGTTVEVPTFDGPVPVEVPAGTQPGETILLRGRGIPPLSRGRTGDIRVVVNVATPRRLSRTQKDLLERFAETITDDNTRSDEGMLAKLKRVLAG